MKNYLQVCFNALNNIYKNGAYSNIDVKQWDPYQEICKITAKQSLQAILDSMDKENKSVLIGQTQLMIVPGYDYRIVKGMITNFHQPQTTLLLLVSAFVGGNWRTIYDYALAHDFRFLSYGDSSILSLQSKI